MHLFSAQLPTPQKTKHLLPPPTSLSPSGTPAHCVKNPHKMEQFHTPPPQVHRKLPHFLYLCNQTLPTGAAQREKEKRKQKKQKQTL